MTKTNTKQSIINKLNKINDKIDDKVIEGKSFKKEEAQRLKYVDMLDRYF